MKLLKLCRDILFRPMVVLVIISLLNIPCAFCQESEDSQIFIAGFNAYQQKDYASSIERMGEVLQKYPDTPLRDMALFWLSQSYYKAGNQQEAARYFSQFIKEYPEHPLKNTVEDELFALAARFDKGEKLTAGTPPVKQADRLAAQKLKAEQERATADEAARRTVEESAAAGKKEQERLAAADAERARMKALKADIERNAAEAERKAEEAKQAIIAAEAARLAQRVSEEEKAVAAKKEQERVAQIEAERARMNALKAENERTTVAEKAESERIRAGAEEVKRATVAAEEARMASRKAEEERLAQQKRTDEKITTVKQGYREKAINQYKDVIEKYPASPAAAAAAAKLRELGVAVAVPTVPAEAPLPENAQVLRFVVAQFAGFEFNIQAHPDALAVGRRNAVPFEVTNRGNGKDSFSLASFFPADFKVRFAAAAAPDVPISQTPELAPEETFKGVIDLVIPSSCNDGMRISYPVKASSKFMAEASQSRAVPLIASAPLLRAVLRTDKATLLPGEKIVYRVSLLNVGTTAADDVRFRLEYPPQLETDDLSAAGLRQESKSALALEKILLKSGENREFTVSFHLKEDSLADQDLVARAELRNVPLATSASFVSNMARVGSRHGVSVHAASEQVVVSPGQKVIVPFVVTNTGNVREKFKISPVTSGIAQAIVFNDQNRDAARQAGEPVIDEIGPLAPREEATVAVEVTALQGAADNSQAVVKLLFAAEGDPASSAAGVTRVAYSRPVLNLTMSGGDKRIKPGDITSIDLSIVNSGSNLARIVELQTVWSEQLEMVASEPSATVAGNGAIVWRIMELGAGEKRNIKTSFRVKAGTGVGTAIRVKNVLTYEDQQGNRY